MTPIIRQIIATNNPDFLIANVDYGSVPPLYNVEIAPPWQVETHAGDEETSIMLHLAPETVKFYIALSQWSI